LVQQLLCEGKHNGSPGSIPSADPHQHQHHLGDIHSWNVLKLVTHTAKTLKKYCNYMTPIIVINK